VLSLREGVNAGSILTVMGFAWVKLKSNKSKENYIGQGYKGLESF